MKRPLFDKGSCLNIVPILLKGFLLIALFGVLTESGIYGQEVSYSTVLVTNEQNLMDALANVEIETIKVEADIDIANGGSMEIKGEKTIIGGSHSFIFEQYCNWTAASHLAVSNLNLQNGLEHNSNDIYWSLEQGCDLSNVKGEDLHIAISACKSSVIDCELGGVSFEGCDNSSVTGSTVHGPITMGNSANTVISDSTIFANDGGTGIIYTDYSENGLVKNTTVYGGAYGVESYIYDGGTISLTNVTLDGCSEYGVYVSNPHSGGCVELENVQISNYGIAAVRCYSAGETNFVTVKEDSKLVLSGSSIPIIINNGGITVEGGAEVLHEGNSYTVYADANSYVFDGSEAFVQMVENASGAYYVTADRGNDPIALNQAEVRNGTELVAALADSTINEVILSEDITVSGTNSITVRGGLKKMLETITPFYLKNLFGSSATISIL